MSLCSLVKLHRNDYAIMIMKAFFETFDNENAYKLFKTCLTAKNNEKNTNCVSELKE